MDPKDASPEPIPRSLDTLPPELLRMVFNYDAVTLADLYRLRGVCKSLGAIALDAFTKRTRYLLVEEKDFFPFLDFFSEFRAPDVDLDDDGEFHPLSPKVVGAMLRNAGVAIDSEIISLIIRQYANDSSFAHRIARCGVYFGMKPGLAELRFITRTFLRDYWDRLNEFYSLNSLASDLSSIGATNETIEQCLPTDRLAITSFGVLLSW